jgi:hypothetical protein
MAMQDLQWQSSVGLAGPPGSRWEAWPPSRVQNPSFEVQILPDPDPGAARSTWLRRHDAMGRINF